MKLHVRPSLLLLVVFVKCSLVVIYQVVISAKVDIDDLLYEIDGIVLINRVDAEAMLTICKKYARAKYPRLKASVIDMIAGEEFQDIMKRWGAERVDMRE